MSDEAPLLVRREGAVVHATMNRPARRNAISTAMGEAWDALLDRLRGGWADARVLRIGGTGGHFCAGLDLGEVASDEPPDARRARQDARNRRIGARFAELAALPQVVVAAVEGSAHAGGLGFVCAADLAFAAGSARFSAPEVRRGLVPAQILPWLARRTGRAAATRLVLEGAAIDATEAARIGLVHGAAADAAALAALVEGAIAAVLQGAPGALAETKALLSALGPVAPAGYAEAAAAAFARTAAGEEAAEGIAAFQQKRAARWVS